MSLSLGEYRTKLIGKILIANSAEGVKRFIDAAMKALRENNVNENIVARFADKVTSDLTQFGAMDLDPGQLKNIEMAKNYFDRIKQMLVTITD